MSVPTKVVADFRGVEIVEVLDASLGARRFFGRQGNQFVTKAYSSPDAVRTELEMRSAKDAAKDWIAPKGLVIAAPDSVILYPLGRAMLLALTFGKYPSGKHNRVFVASFPALILAFLFAALTAIYG